MSDFAGSTERTSEGFKAVTQSQLIADLQAARVQAGITAQEAAKKIGIPAEVFDDVEAGRITLNLSEIRAYAYAVDAVIEYSVTTVSSSE